MGREEEESQHDIRQVIESAEVLLRQAHPYQNPRQEIYLQVPLQANRSAAA